MTVDTVQLDALEAGDDVATDLITAKHYQQVKLVDGTVGAITPIESGGGVEAGALRVTVASDSTGVLSVDDNGGSLTIDGTVTANLSATDNAVLDTIDTALDAINAKLVAGTVIGEVEIGAASTAAGDLAKAEDAAHTSGDVGVMALAVRNDDLAALAGTDGDYAPLQVDAMGALYTNDSSVTVGFSTFATLANGVAYTSSVIDLGIYSQVSTSVLSDVDGTITIEFVRDVSAADVLRTLTIPYTGGSGFQMFAAPAFTPYVRYTFTCDEVGQADFWFDTVLLKQALSGQILGMDAFISSSMVAPLTRSSIVAKDPSGAYVNARSNKFGAVEVETEQHTVFDDMDALTQNGGTWAAIDSDTTGVALSTKHVQGTGSIEFDKVDGAANSGIGGIEKTLTAVDLGDVKSHDVVSSTVYVSSVTDISDGTSYYFIRLGTDSSNYNEWRIDGASLTAGVWQPISMEVGTASFDGQTGNGCDFSAITYVAAGLLFDGVADTLANIYIDEIAYNTNQRVAAAIGLEVSSTVSSANINVQKVGGSAVTKGSGNVGNGTQRVTLATDDANTAAMVVDLAAIEVTQNTIIANQVAKATGGHSFDMLAMAAEDNDKVIKASAGTVYWISAQSIDATPVYLKLFNAASITPGTTAADLQFLIPTQGTANGAGLVVNFGDHGIEFGTGICALVSTDIALDGNTAVSANEVVVTLGFE